MPTIDLLCRCPVFLVYGLIGALASFTGTCLCRTASCCPEVWKSSAQPPIRQTTCTDRDDSLFTCNVSHRLRRTSSFALCRSHRTLEIADPTPLLQSVGALFAEAAVGKLTEQAGKLGFDPRQHARRGFVSPKNSPLWCLRGAPMKGRSQRSQLGRK